MKKIQIIALLIFSLLSVTSHAQLLIGVRGGPGLIGCWSKSANVTSFIGGLGYAAGPGGSLDLSICYTNASSFTFVTGLGWRQRGAGGDVILRDSLWSPLGIGDLSFYNDHISIPFLARIQTRGKVKFMAEFGPYFDFRLPSAQLPKKIRFTDPPLEGFALDDFGFSIGVGGIVPLGEKFQLLLSLREDLGIFRRGVDPSFQYISTYLTLGLEYRLR